jgi:hypothetical protein
MTISIRVDGIGQLTAAMGEYAEKARVEIGKAITATALLINGDVKRAIQGGPKSGATYYRIPGDKYMTVRVGGADGTPVAFIPGGGKKNLSPIHKASAPKEAPATDTGGLVRSIYFEQPNKLQATIGSRLAYAYWLEFGTVKIKPRPSWVPAVEKNKGELARRVGEALAKVKL